MTQARSQAYKAPEYQRNRRMLLSDKPLCALRLPGCTGAATTVDHIVSLQRGGDHSLANLQPACNACNASKGGREGRAKQLRTPTKPAQKTADGGFFGDTASQHTPHCAAISPRRVAELGRLDGMLQRVPTSGRIEPRLATPAKGSGSYGQGVTRWATERMPNPPMAWNRLAWDMVLAHDDAGRFVHRQALVSVARQNAKTTWAEALVGWRLTDYARDHGPQTVLWVCHDLRLSEQVFILLGRLLEPQVAYRSNSFGRQRMVLQDGSTFAIASNTAAAGHGWSPDLCVVDECWKVKPEAVNHGLMPAMRARPQPQIVLASTAGDENSELLKLWRERGLSLIEAGQPGALAMLEWSMPPDVDWHQPEWWAWPNPCLGTTLTPETLLAEYQGPDRGAFLRGSLNVWTSSADGWLPVGQWDACRAVEAREAKGGVVACEVSQSGERFYALRAWQHNGVTWCAPFLVTEHEDELWSALDDVYGQLERVAITPTLEAHLPPQMVRKHVVVGMKELAKNVPLVRNMIASGNVAHGPSPMLDEHVGRAVATRTAGLSTAHSSGSIELARCLVWAASLSSRPSGSRRPGMGTARGDS